MGAAPLEFVRLRTAVEELHADAELKRDQSSNKQARPSVRSAWHLSGWPMTTKPAELKPWELSEKIDADPRALVQHDSDQLGKLFLALAVAYNDLKGLVLFDIYLQAMGRPESGDWSTTAGQWRGAVTQVHRWIAGVLHELMVAIQNNRNVVRGDEFKRLVTIVDAAGRESCKEFIDAALNTSSKTASMLQRIRNNAAFHYGLKDLNEGYRKHFVIDAKDNPTPANQTAQYCYGPDMDGTRFFYADAAVQQRMMMLGLQFGAPEADRALVKLAESVNQWLVLLIGAFIYARTRRLGSAIGA